MVRRVGIGFNPHLPIRETVDFAQHAERTGYDSFWMHETYFQRDAISYLAAAAMVTERIRLGLGCINVFTRNAALIAMTAGAIDELSGERFILGIGMGGLLPMTKLGYKVVPSDGGRPIVTMSETIEAVRRLSTGEPVTMHGEFIDFDGVKLVFPPRQRRLPIYIATTRPRLVQLAKNIADGVILPGVATTIEGLKDQLDSVKRGSPLPADFEIADYLMCSVGTNRSDALDCVRQQGFLLDIIARSSQEQYMERYGVMPEETQKLREAWQRGDRQAASAALSDAMISAFTISGTPEECLSKFEEYRKTGITLPIIMPIGDIKLAIETFSA